MPNTTSSPNMGLPIPVVGVDPGPDYANNLNACLTLVDAHNHSVGSGVQITPSGMNINADLSFSNNNGTSFRSLRFFPQGSVLSGGSDLGCLYEVTADLYYNDGSGNQIRITQGGAVAGTPGSIANLVSPASASYVSANKTFVWQSDASTPGNLDAASILLRNLVANSKALTLQPPNAMGANYTLTLPSLPGQTNVMTLSSGGTMGSITYDSVGQSMTSTGANALRASTTKTLNATATAGNVAWSDTSAHFVLSSTTETQVTNLNVTITTLGKPIVIKLVPNGTLGHSSYVQAQSSTSSCSTSLICRRGGTSGTILGTQFVGISSGSGTSSSISVPVSSFEWYDLQAAGTYNYVITVQNVAGTNITVEYASVKVYEEN